MDTERMEQLHPRSPKDQAELAKLAAKDRFREKFDKAAGTLRESLLTADPCDHGYLFSLFAVSVNEALHKSE